MTTYYIGLMSGTSLDGIDAALLDLRQRPHLLAQHSHPLPDPLRQQLYQLQTPGENELSTMMRLDVELGRLFAEAVHALLAKADKRAGEIAAIGSHGQTLRHYPDGPTPSTLQIGDPNLIAELTGITTVADLRRRDLAAGGQGAPLVPAFHAAMFHRDGSNRAILNLGGIANLTLLPADNQAAVTGFDTGPGNGLLDSWIARHQQQRYDRDGEWAASGHVHPGLLERLLHDPYFARPPPKSTGREYFNLNWLQPALEPFADLAPRDVQATLCELSARSIAEALQAAMDPVEEVLICGGGIHNRALYQRLEALLTPARLASTAEAGLDPDWVEAAAFAWLAKQTLAGDPGNLPSVTGASHPVVLGGIYPGKGPRAEGRVTRDEEKLHHEDTKA
ncbi:anhydro-N-acetylmuramic acid kinase [Thiohalophilus thiocyanatoxydans]|uniref:Anhydro-N-acetylmuramic acid kinase n=1 Tax=Thiohalophilus thiocyanatoxydans TaxID=381308 RepID=A0A4R8IIH8_9GAMM|nr:anhydro-N-acetylmuramic acid kinase [Thiohalophilus thiocyanatoxydans]TDY00452.1 anhydro-N-acetylmuramic acid kinase [Thiohalophilus thiocyanatoxydans]